MPYQTNNLRNAAVADCQKRYGITAQEDPLWRGQLAAGLPMAPKDVADKYFAYTYSRSTFALKFPDEDFSGLEESLALAQEMGIEVIAYHKYALLIHVSEGCRGNAWEFGKKLAERVNLHLLEEDEEEYNDEVIHDAYGDQLLIN